MAIIIAENWWNFELGLKSAWVRAKIASELGVEKRKNNPGEGAIFVLLEKYIIGGRYVAQCCCKECFCIKNSKNALKN